MTRAILAAAIATVVVILAATGYLLLREGGPAPSAAVQVAGSDIGGPFELTTHQGKRITSEELIDGPTLVYFGYTFCPDVCPVDAARMAEATDLLAKRGIEVTPVFITIDPARDTPEALADFVGAMHPKMIGLTGSPEEIRAAADAYKVYFAKVENEDAPDDYLMSHTSYIYLMTPDGIAGLFRQGTTAREIADEAARILGG